MYDMKTVHDIESTIAEMFKKRSQIEDDLRIARENNRPHKRIENQLVDLESKIEDYSDKLGRAQKQSND
jgi:hypothetical protein